MILDALFAVAVVAGLYIGLKKGFYKLVIKPLLFWISLIGGFILAFWPMVVGEGTLSSPFDAMFVGMVGEEMAAYIGSLVVGIILAVIIRLILAITLGSCGQLLKHNKVTLLLNKIFGVIAGLLLGLVVFFAVYMLFLAGSAFSPAFSLIVVAEDGFINIGLVIHNMFVDMGYNIPHIIRSTLLGMGA